MPRPVRKPAVLAAEVSAPVAAPLPPVTSPAVHALQQNIVGMVAERLEKRKAINIAQSALFQAQASLQAATAEMQGLEGEVNYLVSLIAQMENRPSNIVPISGPTQYPSSLAGISVDPAPMNNAQYSDPADQVNRGHASRAML